MADDEVLFDENNLYMGAENPDVFYAEIVETDASSRCHLSGTYELHVNTTNIALIDQASGQVLYTWPLRYLRRYGRSPTTFQFDAGRRCPSGEGRFIMKTEPGKCSDIISCIEARLKIMKEQDRQYAGKPASSAPAAKEQSAAPDGRKPATPARHYSKTEYQNLVGPNAKGPTTTASKPRKKMTTGEKGFTEKAAGPLLPNTVLPHSNAADGRPRSGKQAIPVADESAYSEVQPLYESPPDGFRVEKNPSAVYAEVKKPVMAPPKCSAPPTAASSDINLLIAGRRETIIRINQEQSYGYGFVGADAAASASALDGYGELYSDNSTQQQYYLVSPTDDAGIVDEIYSEPLVKNLGKPK